MSASPDRFVTVAYVYSPSDLAILLSLFRNEGIYVNTMGQGHGSADPGLAIALGGVAVRVHEEDFPDARTLLASLELPYRIRLLREFPIGVLLLLVAGLFFGAGPPPRMMPCFLLGGTEARRED